MSFQKKNLLYYSRQIMMDEIGAKGQLKLKKSKVCVVGLGWFRLSCCNDAISRAWGSVFCVLLTGTLVDVTNLHRQHLYGVDKEGFSKVEVAAERIAKFESLHRCRTGEVLR